MCTQKTAARHTAGIDKRVSMHTLLEVDTPAKATSATDAENCAYVCQTCGAPMHIIERLEPNSRAPPVSKPARP
jgi:hypothetical protein